MPRGHVIVVASVWAAFPFLVWACGLTADFSNLTGGTRDSGVDSASTDAGDDAGDAHGVEAAPQDAADASAADTGADACTAAPSYCASLPSPKPLFCSDFDDCKFPLPWTDELVNGGLLGLEFDLQSTTVHSRPRSLVVQDTSMSAQTDSADVRTSFSSTPAGSTLTFAFWIQLVNFDGEDQARLVVAAIDFLDAPDGGASTHLQFTVFKNNTMFNAALEELAAGCGGFLSHPLTDPLLPNNWTNVRITVKRSAGTAPTASVSFGGSAPELPDTQLCANVDASPVRIGVGSLFRMPSTAAWKNRFDDVTFDVGP
jgi:hypothetical protein